ncbi:TOMM20-like protein 1 [Dinochytrium kinnereticum]|nr:TOMM20-like protein 1 [Dinochytrium kinnereticum]
MQLLPSNSNWVNATVVASICAVGYLIYFDQRRQYDPEFRRSLRRERKLAEKIRSEEEQKAKARAKASMDFMADDDDKLPTTEEEKQKYLSKQLILGEQLLSKGPSHYRAAATCLYRAIKIYPEPLKLLMAFQETVPPPVLEMIMGMMAMDVDNAKASRPSSPVGPSNPDLD